MALDEKGQPIPPAGPGSEGGEKKKIAGKFNTVEELGEGYLGLEKGFHEMGEKVSALTKVIEAALTSDPGAPPVAPSRGSGGPDPYGRQPASGDDRINPADFISDPGTFLRQRDERLLQGVVQIIGNAMAGKEAVDEFKRANPDLIKHEKLVKAFMKELDPRLAIDKRLEEAGKQVRTYLATVKADLAGNNSQAPGGADYVEEPRGPSGYGRPLPNQQQSDEAQEAKELADYIRERQTDFAEHFGTQKLKE